MSLFVGGSILVSMKLLHVFSTTSITAFVIPFLYFDRYIVELGIFLLVTIGFIYQEGKMRYVGYGLMGVFILISLIQLISIGYGGEFVPAVAFEKIDSIGLVANGTTIGIVVLGVALCALMIVVLEKFFTVRLLKKKLVVVFGIIALITLAVALDFVWLPSRPQEKVEMFFSEQLFTHSSPVGAFLKTLINQKTNISLGPSEAVQFSTEESELLNNYGLQTHFENKYPLVKDTFYNQTKKSLIPIIKRNKKPNVIIFFVEGFSARTIGAYNSEFTELTPNIDAFAKNAMVVKNYYNHTAATDRGLRGQLCSLYPYLERILVHTLCLNNVLKKNGYDTLFVTSENKDNSSLDELATDLDFDHVITGEVLLPFLPGQKDGRGGAVSDTQLFQGLLPLLNTNRASEEPFFVSIYNVGTHAFIDVGASEEKYQQGDNQTLNTIHNFDRGFGIFWSEFKKSPFAQNTIIIITTDHAHYPEASYKKIITSDDYQEFFVDQVPLIVYDPRVQLPSTFDAHDATSINLTPTLLQYLNIPNEKNAFIGTSLFDGIREEMSQGGIAAYNGNYYFIQKNHIYSLGKPEDRKVELDTISKYIRAVYQLQMGGRVWDNK